MANLMQIKADVVNELRNEIYYGQLEVQRLFTSPNGLTHKEVVDKIVSQLKKNVVAANAIDLMELHLPSAQTTPQTSQVQEAHKLDEDTLGIKKIE